jgi:hypothetical protein
MRRTLSRVLAFVLGLGAVLIVPASAQVGGRGVGGVPQRLNLTSLQTTLAGDGATVGSLESNSAIPQLNFFESDAAANNGHWLCGVNNEQFRCRTSVDDGSAVGTWLLIDRTAQTIDTLALSATAITLNGVAASDFGRLSQVQTFAGQNIFGDAAAVTGTYSTPGTGGLAVFMDANGIGAVPRVGAISLTSAASQPLELWASSVGVTLDGVTRVDLTPVSGTVTASFDDACSTTPTATLDYQRIGNVVVMRVDDLSGFACTGDSASFRTTGTPLPAAIRPAENIVSPIQGGFTNNGTATQACWFVEASGNVSFNVNATSGCAGTWTASGNRSMPTGLVISYPLGNP